jgi:ribose 5-phosphate isomerase A
LEELKRNAACKAVEEYVKSGMVVGLGTGTTASWVIRHLGELLARGELQNIRGISTSHRSTSLALESGIPLVTLTEARPDLTIDGADEISPDLDLVKGRGGALLREKIVAAASDALIVVADETKLFEQLGHTRLPVEVEPFGWETTLEALSSLGSEPELRTLAGEPVRTDGNHYTIDCAFGLIEDPAALEAEIKRIPGALECGLFVNMARAAVIGSREGTRILKPR